MLDAIGKSNEALERVERKDTRVFGVISSLTFHRDSGLSWNTKRTITTATRQVRLRPADANSQIHSCSMEKMLKRGPRRFEESSRFGEWDLTDSRAPSEGLSLTRDIMLPILSLIELI